MRIQRGDHKARTRYGDEQIYLVRPHSAALQAFFRRLASELYRVFDVFIVGLRERARLDGVIERKNRVALVHLRVVHDRHHRFQPPFRNIENTPHVVLHILTGDRVGRQRRGRGGNIARRHR